MINAPTMVFPTVPLTSKKACASDYDGGYGDHLETCSGYRLRGAKAGSEYEACETTKKAADRVDAEFDKIDVDPRCSRRVLVAADCVDVPSEASAVQHKGCDTRHTEQDNHQVSGSDRPFPVRGCGTTVEAGRRD